MAQEITKEVLNEFEKIIDDEYVPKNIKSKISLGAPGNLDINYYKNRIAKI